LSEILVETPVLLDYEHYVLDLGAAGGRDSGALAGATAARSNTQQRQDYKGNNDGTFHFH
jgi:hypothetical protein